MAQLAIRGHATRGREVIEILEMLGGSNPHNYCADCDSLCFTIGKGTNIIYYDWVKECYEDEYTLVFTLEEFLEKFPYKVGDKVQHKGATSCGPIFEVEVMRWEEDTVKYTLCLFGCNYKRSTLPAAYLQPYKEAPMYLNAKANKQFEEIEKILKPVKEIMEEIKLDIPDGYEFFGIDDDNKVVLTKKQPQYPKTYVECAKILDCFSAAYIDGYKNDLLEKLQELLVCRDAYWKIAGEQMGLSEPWKPDWLNTEQDKYVLYTHNNIICLNRFVLGHNVLAFPTAEMRDAFLENFKELIELCKDLL